MFPVFIFREGRILRFAARPQRAEGERPGLCISAMGSRVPA